ncbi:hypothetical protein E8E13_009836 [Curvularia kusanoi]|uniref:Uncharacterized protein n=1 Tax=Curvularia kusanoi TaxID=90978 RepID=A0A9P4TKA6_CURKU|nr:hypothetical protein E8E13_009836 [Curvularia kusanoi]
MQPRICAELVEAMTAGEKRSTDVSNRLNKRGGKLISKTLGKSSSPPSINTPPKAAVSAPKAKKDEVQRRKSSLQDMLRGTAKESDVGQAATALISPSPASGSRGNATSKPLNGIVSVDQHQSRGHEDPNPSNDDRLKNLDKLLATAREETIALRLELDRVKQDAQASVEISKYQVIDGHRQTTPANNTHYHQTDQQHIGNGMRNREEELENQNYELRSCLAALQDQLEAQNILQPPQASRSEEDWNVLTLRLHETEKESHARLQQLLLLKSSISTLTRTDSQVSDSELADMLSQLANKVREWVVSHYRRTKMNLDNLPDSTIQVLQSISANYQKVDSADKLVLYQAIVSKILMRILQAPLCVGMPNHGIFAGLEAFCKVAQLHGHEFCKWRRSTIRLIERTNSSDIVDSWRDQELSALAGECEAIMRSISSIEFAPSARSALIGIMMLAARLQRILGLQKAVYSFVVFDALHKQDCHIDQTTMEPVNDFEYSIDECNEPDTQRNFMFCVFPGLEKVEDESGAIVFKAKVCCGVG